MTTESTRPVPARPPYLRDDALLTVSDLHRVYSSRRGTVTAVSGVSFDVLPGETLGLVGESGCGKTTTGRALLMLPPPTAGTVTLSGVELGSLPRRELRRVRQRIQMVFQDPVSAFNPRRRVADLVAEGLKIAKIPDAEIATRVDDALAQVGLDPDSVRNRRPGQLSGGQNQRVAIARALALHPEIVVCDEPVASLDVSVQAQVLNVLRDIKRKLGMSLIFISHDLSVVRYISERVAVMYAGKIVEIGTSAALFASPAHHYTRLLLDAVPTIDEPPVTADSVERRRVVTAVPTSGCSFSNRCPRAEATCFEVSPELTQVDVDHFAACHFPLARDTAPADAAHR